ncbi:hypothetical protein [Streptomyces sp. NPDC020681]|uniref:hypothetical protein n=1 Tax=Streptomyces sp. NPDC020681 TaxID=3365083 RepID=UPI0037ACC00C
MPLRLAKYGVPLAETAPADLAAAGIELALLPPSAKADTVPEGLDTKPELPGSVSPDWPRMSSTGGSAHSPDSSPWFTDARATRRAEGGAVDESGAWAPEQVLFDDMEAQFAPQPGAPEDAEESAGGVPGAGGLDDFYVDAF